MTLHATIGIWDKFLNRYYLADILALANEYPDKRSLYIDFINVDKFKTELADELLNNPVEAIALLKDAFNAFDLPIHKSLAAAHIRIQNVPNFLPIREIRSEHIGELVAIDGLVRVVTDVRPDLFVGAFECMGCGNIMTISQPLNTFTEPYICSNEGCGRQKMFKLLVDQSEFVDGHRIRVQESPEDLRGGEQPQTLDIAFEDDIAGIVSPGDHVTVVGILRSYQRITRAGKSTTFDIVLDANSIELHDKEFTEVEITPEEEKEIIKLSKDPDIYANIIQSIAPSIYGYEEVKEGLALQIMSGVSKNLPDGTRIRGDVHILLVGDPGIAKSQLLRYVTKLAPRGIYTSGRSSSAVGLCVAPDTRIQASDGFHNIQDFVEARMTAPVQVEQGIWKSNCNTTSIATLNTDHSLTKHPLKAVWRIRAPGVMIRITTMSGRTVTATPATPFPVMTECGIEWVKSMDLTDQHYLVTPRHISTTNSTPYIINLFESDCTVGGTAKIADLIRSTLEEKTGFSSAAQSLGVLERNLRHNLLYCWNHDDVRGNPSLHALLRLAELVEIDVGDVAQNCRWFSQRDGHKITLPTHLNEDFMYFVGLIAGDGSVNVTKPAVGVHGKFYIRFSNSNEHLLEKYISIITKLFSVSYNRSTGSNARPPEVRFGSKIITEILRTLGVPQSPKSARLTLPDTVLNLPNPLIAAYLRGLLDTDGSCSLLRSGSSRIELYTASKQLAEGVQLALLKFGIIGWLRVRQRSGTTTSHAVDGVVKTINTAHDIYVVTIFGKENLTRYHDQIGFEHPVKHANLVEILTTYKTDTHSTNADRVPHVGTRIQTIRKHFGLPLSIYGTHTGGLAAERGCFMPTHHYLQMILPNIKECIDAGGWQGMRILLPSPLRSSIRELLKTTTTNLKVALALNLPATTTSEYFYRLSRDTTIPYRVLLRFSDFIQKFDHDLADDVRNAISGVVAEEPNLIAELDSLMKLSTGDIFFDKIKSIDGIRDHGYEYVYDLTVANTHNFGANALLAHNTASAVKNDLSGGDGRWTLEAGALVLADHGIVAIDELDKMRPEDRSALHESAEQQSVTVAKAGILTTLKSRCAILAAANPKHGRFDPYESIASQVAVAPALLSRFDLIYILKDEPNAALDGAIADHILDAHYAGGLNAQRTRSPTSNPTEAQITDAMKMVMPIIPPDLLRLYVAYAKKNIFPIVPADVRSRLREFYLSLRKQGEDRDAPVPATARQLEALERLCEASARLRLSETATMDDAARTIRVTESCLRNVAYDRETGLFDADILTGVGKSQRDKFKKLRTILIDIAEDSNGDAPEDTVLTVAETQGLGDEAHVRKMLKDLMVQGEIYTPREGVYRVA